MTDIVARTSEALTALLSRTLSPDEIALALHDAGLLAEPTRTVPTREEIAVIFHAGFDVRGEGICSSCTLAAENADAILALLAGQPTVAEAKARALEEAAELTDNPHEDYWLRERAQQIRDGK